MFVPCVGGLGVSLTLSSSMELRALPARICWRTKKVPETRAEDAVSDLGKSGRPCLQFLPTFPAPPSSLNQALANLQ